MRTTMITQQSLHHGEELLRIYRSTEGYYVAHVNARGHILILPEAKYARYMEAENRLQQEVRERS